MRCVRQPVVLPGGLTYWTVVDPEFKVVEPFNRFLRYLRIDRQRPESTTKQYSSTLAEWATWLRQRGIANADMRVWVEDLGHFRFHLATTPIERPGRGQGRVRGEQRIGNMLATIRSLFAWAVPRRLAPPEVNELLYEVVEPRGDYGWLEDLPGRVARPLHRTRAVGESEPIPVTMPEFIRMFTAPGMLRDKLLICLLGVEGMRVAEAVSLRRSAMHLAPNSMQLGCAVKGPHIHVIGKGNKARWVPAHSYLVSTYAAHLWERAAVAAAEQSDFVLINLKGGEVGTPLSTSRARRIVAALARRAGLDRHVTPHQFRHGLATALVEQKRPLDEVQKILGHANIETTRRYTKTSDERLREAVESVPLPGRSA
jgi:integrase/recombinase XerD